MQRCDFAAELLSVPHPLASLESSAAEACQLCCVSCCAWKHGKAQHKLSNQHADTDADGRPEKAKHKLSVGMQSLGQMADPERQTPERQSARKASSMQTMIQRETRERQTPERQRTS